jgi:small subunit ribosomal protein S19e
MFTINIQETVMVSIKGMDPDVLIEATAEKLKGLEALKQPEWSLYVKTGHGRERPPQQDGWWHRREASILRKLYLGQAAGVGEFRKVYGNKKNRGHKPEHKVKASGKVIRVILQQLESAGLVKKEKEGGRSITSEGRRLLNEAAKSIK